MSDPSALPSPVRTFLRAYVLRARRLAALRGLGWSAATLAGLILCGCLIDRVVPMSRSLRGVWLAISLSVSLLLLLRPLWRMRAEIDWVAAAAGVEGKSPRFGQRLLTLVSRATGRTDYRGSAELLDELAFGLERDTRQERPATLLPVRVIAPAWLLLGAIVLMSAALARSTELNLPQLVRRLVLPWEPTPAVTTTQVQVTPGDMDIQQGAAARIEATVTRLHGGSVTLNLAEGNDEEWQRLPMVPADDAASAASPAAGAVSGRFAYTLPSVDRDLRYYVSAGDATSETYTLRVLRRPAISEFRFRMVYPSFVGKLPAMLVSRDGRIEAPIGTEVQLTITATEPLQSALLTVGGEKQLMLPLTDAPSEFKRQGKLTVTGNGRYDIDLITTRLQTGSGPATTEIRATPDRPPSVRLSGSKSFVRLGPADVLPLALEVTDDFGVNSLAWHVTTAAGNFDFPAWPYVRGSGGSAFNSLRGDRRRLEGAYELDLALLPLTPGDVATITLVARDSGNHPTESDPLFVLATRGVASPYIYEQAAELKASSQWAVSAGDDLDQAIKALAQTSKDDEGSAARSRAISRATRAMRSAANNLALLRRSLLRVVSRSNPPDVADALETWLDQASETARLLDQAYRGDMNDRRLRPGTQSSSPTTVPTPSASDLLQTCKQASERLSVLRDRLRNVAAGAQAATVLADLQNVADADHRRNGQQVQAIRKDIADAVKGLGLSEGASNLPAKLREIVERGASVARAQSRSNLSAAVAEWAEAVAADQRSLPPLADRLFAAARAHAERAEGDPRFAANLNLTGLVAADVAAGGTTADAARELADAFRVFATAHQLRDIGGAITPALDSAADAARARLHGHDGSRSAATPAVRAARIESIAMAASIAAADHDFTQAAAVDQQLSKLAVGQLDATAVAAAQQPLSRCRSATQAAARIEQILSDLARHEAHGGRAGAAADFSETANQIADLAAQFAPVGSSRVIAIADNSRRDRRGWAVTTVEQRLASGPWAAALMVATAASFDSANTALAANDPLTAAKWNGRRIAEGTASVERTLPALIVDLQVAQRRFLRFAAAQRMAAVRAIRPAAVLDASDSSRNAAITRPFVRAPLPGIGMTDLLPALPLGPEISDEGFNDPETPGYEAAIRAYREATRKSGGNSK